MSPHFSPASPPLLGLRPLRTAVEAERLPGLYVHLPFCLTKCPYCGFFSHTDLSQVPAFLKAIQEEIALCADLGTAFDTVYLGGGTPSVLGGVALEQLMAALQAAFTITGDAEITCETNPGDLTAELLLALRRAGVNRLTIGCQSFDDQTLAFLGRRHKAAEAISAVGLARQFGFANLAIDLIYGLPDFDGDTLDTWISTLETALALKPEHLSCYQLTLEPGTPLAERLRRDHLSMPGEETQARYFHCTADILEEAGYIHYEVSNFALEERFYSRHNSKYWDHTSYLGLGPAAHSFTGRERRWNHQNIHRYLQDLDAGRLPVAGSETLNDEQLALETLFLGLRTRRGIGLIAYRNRFGTNLEIEKRDMLKELVKEGLVDMPDCWLRPTRAGMAVADSLALI